jgi:hypothetical protein
MTQSDLSFPVLIRETFIDPRGVARRLVAVGMPAPMLWQALLLVVVVSVLLEQVLFQLGGGVSGLPADTDPVTAQWLTLITAFYTSPPLMTFLQGVLLTITVFTVYTVGRAFGGTGTFEAALVMVVWFQFILVTLQAAQSVATVIFPLLALLIGFGTAFFFFYLLTMFVCEIHGFKQTGAVLAMIIVSIIVITVFMAVFASIIFQPFIGDLPNV